MKTYVYPIGLKAPRNEIPHKKFSKNDFYYIKKKTEYIQTKGQLISKCPFGVIVSKFF